MVRDAECSDLVDLDEAVDPAREEARRRPVEREGGDELLVG